MPHHASGLWKILARLACARPWTVLAVAVAVAAASVAFTISSLRFQPGRNDLISPDLNWNRRAIAWWDQFPAMTVATIVIDTWIDGVRTPESVERAERIATAIAGRLEAIPEVAALDWGAARGEFSPATLRLAPMRQFEGVLGTIREESAPILGSPRPSDLLTRTIAALASAPTDAAAEGSADGIDGLIGLLRAIRLAAETPGAAARAFASLDGEDPGAWRFLATPNGRFLLVRATPHADEEMLNADALAIAAIRREIDAARSEDPAVDVGMTGVDVIEADETRVATTDSAVASVLAAIAITVLLVIAFHGWRKPVFSMAALLIAIAWSFGYLTLVIGHLQILSVVFVVILLGLGIDYAIHISTTLEEYRHDHPDTPESFQDAIEEVLRSTAPGIGAGAITTAAAFLVTTFSDFLGVAEMGLIAFGGIILCLIAMLTVFPAFLALCVHGHDHIIPLHKRSVHVFRAHWLTFVHQHPATTLTVAAVLSIGALALAPGARFESDLIALQPRGVPSIEWHKRLADEGDVSVWFGVSIVRSVAEARQRAEALAALPTVSGLGGIAVLTPLDEPRRLDRLRETREYLAPELARALAEAPANGDDALVPQLRALRSLLEATLARDDVPAAWRDRLALVRDELTPTVAVAESSDEGAIAAVASGYAALRRSVAERIEAALSPDPLTPDDLPRAFLAPYIDDADPAAPRYALEIYPDTAGAGAASPLERAFLTRFVDDVTAVDPEATGVMFQIHYSSDLIRRSFLFSGIAALVVVLLIVLALFRSLHDAILSITPVGLGFLFTLATLRLLDHPIDLANIVVLPLLFGIGVDNGIHMLHRYHLNPHERPLGLTHGAGKGVMLTSLTTMLGFGCMMISRHRGIAGLGLTLTLGIGYTLLACLFVLPAWLEWRQRLRPKRAPLRRGSRLTRPQPQHRTPER